MEVRALEVAALALSVTRNFWVLCFTPKGPLYIGKQSYHFLCDKLLFLPDGEG